MSAKNVDLPFPIGMIISGGQTGVDRAALDFAIESGIPCAGWCPAGRRSEAGPIPDRYPLIETTSSAYPQRTRQNVQDSDATLIFTAGTPTGGTALTAVFARRLRRPHLIVDLDMLSAAEAAEIIKAWLNKIKPYILNVAGPRASEAPQLPELVQHVLISAISPPPVGSQPPTWPPPHPKRPSQKLLFSDTL